MEAAVLSTVEARLLAASALVLSAPSLLRRDLRLVTIVVDTRTPLMPIDEFSGKRGARPVGGWVGQVRGWCWLCLGDRLGDWLGDRVGVWLGV